MDRHTLIRSFVLVADNGSFAAAALSEGVTPVVMGRRLDALERHLGVKLMHRSTRGLQLTDLGEQYLDRARSLLKDFDEADASVARGGKSVRGHLVVSAPAAFGRRHIAPHAAAFLLRYPDLKLSFNFTDSLVDLVRQGYDMGIRIGEVTDPNYVSGYVKSQGGGGGDVISGDLDGKATVTEDTATGASGRIVYPALSGGVASFDPATNTQQGRYGKLEVKVDGSWSYTLGNDAARQARVQALRDGDVRSEVFVLTTTDGSQTTVTLTVLGSTDQPQAQLASLTEGGMTQAAGRLQDKLAGLAGLFLPGSFQGELGQLQLAADGAWQFVLTANVQALAAGSSRRESFTVYTVDGSATTVTVEVLGVNNTAVVQGVQQGAVAQDGVRQAQGLLQVTDVDAGEAAFKAASLSGRYGVLTLASGGGWVYTLNDASAVAKGQTVDEVFAVETVDGTGSSITIAVTGGNHAAVVGGVQTGAVAQDGVQQVQGRLTVSDSDAGEAVFQPAQQAGRYGSFALQADGSWLYQLLDGSSIAKGQTEQEQFVVRSADGTESRVTVDVTGGNHAATIGGQQAGAVAQDGRRTASGTLQVSDRDAGEAVFVAQQSQGRYGQLQLQADGSWVYQLQDAGSLDKGATVQEQFVVRSADGSAANVVIAVTGGNHAAVIGGQLAGAVAQDGNRTASGALQVSDRDSGEAVFVAQASQGRYGQLQLQADGSWVYQLQDASAVAKGASVSEVFTVASADGSTMQLVVSVTVGNHAAELGGVRSGAVAQGGQLTASGQLSIRDADAGEAVFVAQTVQGRYGEFVQGADGRWQYRLQDASALDKGAVVNEQFDARSADGSLTTVTVSVTGGNHAASLSGTRDGSVKAGAQELASGVVQVSDRDRGEAGLQAGQQQGQYGVLTVLADGRWQYQLGGTLTPADGSQQQERFVVQSLDGSASLAIVVSVAGADIKPQTSQQVVQALALAGNGSTPVAGSTAGTATPPAATPQAAPLASDTGSSGDTTVQAEGEGPTANEPVVNLQTLGQVLFTGIAPLSASVNPVSPVAVELAPVQTPAQQVVEELALSAQAPEQAETAPAAAPDATAEGEAAPASEAAPAPDLTTQPAAAADAPVSAWTGGSDVVFSAALQEATPVAAHAAGQTAEAAPAMAGVQDLSLGLAALTGAGRGKILWDKRPAAGNRSAERGNRKR